MSRRLDAAKVSVPHGLVFFQHGCQLFSVSSIFLIYVNHRSPISFDIGFVGSADFFMTLSEFFKGDFIPKSGYVHLRDHIRVARHHCAIVLVSRLHFCSPLLIRVRPGRVTVEDNVRRRGDGSDNHSFRQVLVPLGEVRNPNPKWSAFVDLCNSICDLTPSPLIESIISLH